MTSGAANPANPGGFVLAPFDTALREAHGRLLAVHSAALATVEAELQRMRVENTRLRLRLVEAGLEPDAKPCVTSTAQPCASWTNLEAPSPVAASLPQPPIGTAVPETSRVPLPEPETAAGDRADASTGKSAGTQASPAEAEPSSHRQSTRAAAEPEIIEVSTPGARAEETDNPVELARALGAVLQTHGLHQLPVRREAGRGLWTVAGVSFQLRFEGPDLHASCDGRSWQLLEAIIVQNLPQLQETLAAGRRQPAPGQARRPTSSQEYVRRQDAPTAVPVAPQDGLPAWRSDGLPSFNNAFPQSFDALSGASQYYSQFRVRVPTASQYESFEQEEK